MAGVYWAISGPGTVCATTRGGRGEEEGLLKGLTEQRETSMQPITHCDPHAHGDTHAETHSPVGRTEVKEISDFISDRNLT